MRTAVRSTALGFVALFAAGNLLGQGEPKGKTGLSISPYIGVTVPTGDLLKYAQSGSTLPATTKIPIGFTFGGRLGIGIGRRVGIDTDVGYSPGSLELSEAGTKVNQDVHTLSGSSKVTFYVIPRTSPVWIAEKPRTCWRNTEITKKAPCRTSHWRFWVSRPRLEVRLVNSRSDTSGARPFFSLTHAEPTNRARMTTPIPM